MSTDSPDFWNEAWSEASATGSGSDEILASQVKHLVPKHALDIGCGLGWNAVWLAENGWEVTAVDYSQVTIEKAKQLADERGVTVEFVVADASTYRPSGQFELITSFFIQLFPEQRAAMLANMSQALVPGGTLLIVSHDRSGSHSGWSEEDQLSLTDPEEIAKELRGLLIERASVLENEWSEHEAQESLDIHDSRTTGVRAVRPI